ncbi:tachykinin-like peptides receptor 86C [Oppia nitens]|uniref:tachykinin-like peptides receptor 86C n=1 Tax=Oppia nitens TaxID=1686743 RepID=UPI0023D9F773|nr:tachykinin-like peptides receptor 86C [Oppia nitens]
MESHIKQNNNLFLNNNSSIVASRLLPVSTKLIVNCLRVLRSSHEDRYYYIPIPELSTRVDCIDYLRTINESMVTEIFNQYWNITSPSNLTIVDDLDNNNGSSDQPLVEHWYVVFLWSVIFCLMVMLAIIGNSMIIWIILSQKIMRTVINIFLLNLTLSDLLTVSLNATFNFVFMLTGHWPFTAVYCVINNFVTNLTIASSVFTATVMSIDRYIAIVHPLKPRMTRCRALVNISLIWLCSAFFASPAIVFSKIYVVPYGGHTTRLLCLMEWPDGLSGQSNFDLAYNIAFLLLTYVLPMLTMAIAYTRMGQVLWDSQQNELNTNLGPELIRQKQKVVRMLICVISVFGICWLPYHSYFLSTYMWPDIIKLKQIKHIYLAIYWLAMANSLFNPIILFVMNRRFRYCITYYMRCQCLTNGGIQLDGRLSVVSSRVSNQRKSSKNKSPKSPKSPKLPKSPKNNHNYNNDKSRFNDSNSSNNDNNKAAEVPV